MEIADNRAARRKRVAELLTRRERRTKLVCSGIAVLMLILVAYALLLRWFTEEPPFMPQ